MSDLHQDLPEDLRDAIDKCKEFQRTRPGAPADPPVFVIEACGETIVSMPPGLESADRLHKLLLSTLDNKKELPKYFETYVAETIFWVRGQTGTGSNAAVTHIKALRKSSVAKYGLFQAITGEVQEHVDNLAGAAPTSKKY